MNRNQLILILVVLAVIGGAGLVLLNHNKESWVAPEAKMGGKVLPTFQPNDVAAIHIKGVSDLNLVRKNDIWRVQERGDYPANFGDIRDVLIKLQDLKVVQSEMVGPSQLSRVELNEPGKGSGTGTLVEFKDTQGKVLDSLLLGKKHSRKQNEEPPSPYGGGASADGRYILLPSDPKEVLLISDALASLDPKAEQWVSKDFFKVEKMKSISLVSTNAANSWKLSRETESSPWVLADTRPGEVLDTNKVSSTASTLGFPSFVDVSSNTAPAETGLDKPMVVTIETFDHFTYSLKIGAKTPEGNYYMTVAAAADIPMERVAGKDEKPDDKKKLDKEFLENAKKLQDKFAQEKALAPWVYIVNSWIVDPLIRDRSQVLVDTKEEKAADGEKAKAEKPPFSNKPGAPVFPPSPK